MTLKVAGVGAGYFSRFHYESWTRMTGADAVAVCDIDLARAKATGFAAYDDLADMLAVEQPDILDVILPPAVQAPALRQAFEAQVETVICQKPFGRDLAEARILTQEAEAARVRLVIHENFRFQPWYRAIKRALEAGEIGQVLQMTFRLRPGDGQGPRAYLDRQPYFQKMERFLVHETAVHWIDTFRFLLGNPNAVYADLRRMNPAIAGEDAGYILSDHPGGVRAIFDGNRLLDHAADNHRRTMGEALIEGTAGTIRLSGDGAVHLRAFGAQTESVLLGPDTHDGFGGDCVHHLQTHVVDAILGGKALENIASDYLRVIEIEEAIYTAAEVRQKITLD